MYGIESTFNTSPTLALRQTSPMEHKPRIQWLYLISYEIESSTPTYTQINFANGGLTTDSINDV